MNERFLLNIINTINSDIKKNNIYKLQLITKLNIPKTVKKVMCLTL